MCFIEFFDGLFRFNKEMHFTNLEFICGKSNVTAKIFHNLAHTWTFDSILMLCRFGYRRDSSPSKATLNLHIKCHPCFLVLCTCLLFHNMII